MTFKLRYFVNGSVECRPEHTFEYTHAARMIIPRVGEYVWLPTNEHDDTDMPEMCCEVVRVTYDMIEDGSNLTLVDVEVVDVTDEIMEEEDY